MLTRIRKHIDHRSRQIIASQHGHLRRTVVTWELKGFGVVTTTVFDQHIPTNDGLIAALVDRFQITPENFIILNGAAS